MKRPVICGFLLLSLTLLGAAFSGCKVGQPSLTPGTAEPDAFAETPDPALAKTLQADVAMTAAWLLTLTPATPLSGGATPVIEPASSVGTPPSMREGVCPAPGGFALQNRHGFCMATPASWVVFNADGGIAGALNTTPDQVLALQPDWARSTAECYLLVYIAAEESALSHLDLRHSRFASQKDIQDVSPIGAYALGEMGILGFTWIYKSGEAGAAYADMVGPGRLLHISYSGSDCLLEDLLPALETLRVNS